MYYGASMRLVYMTVQLGMCNMAYLSLKNVPSLQFVIFLNQACAGCRPVLAWFLKITFNVRVYACVRPQGHK